jgi:hypothetical protein
VIALTSSFGEAHMHTKPWCSLSPLLSRPVITDSLSTLFLRFALFHFSPATLNRLELLCHHSDFTHRGRRSGYDRSDSGSRRRQLK